MKPKNVSLGEIYFRFDIKSAISESARVHNIQLTSYHLYFISQNFNIIGYWFTSIDLTLLHIGQ